MTDIHLLTRDLLARIEQPQRQDGANAQIADLLPFAQRLGVPVPPSLAPVAGQALTPRLEALQLGLPESPVLDLDADQALTVLRTLDKRLGFYDAAEGYWLAGIWRRTKHRPEQEDQGDVRFLAEAIN